MDLIYLDNNATTRPAPEVVAAMTEMLAEWYGNPSSVHRFGQRARAAVDHARAQVCGLIGCAESEILFTGGGTEAINTAIRGLFTARSPRKKIVTTAVEHSATHELCKQLALQGAVIVEIGVDRQGRIDLEAWQSALDDSTALATALWANNETGVIFPAAEMAAACKSRGVPFHCDGTQAAGKIPVDVKAAGFDCMSLAAHKFHGPKGIGALYIRRGLRLPPLIIGGPQERNRRGGTENVPGIVGMGKAAELAAGALGRMTGVAALRDRLETGILQSIPETAVNGDPSQRLPNTTNIGFSRLEAEAILLLLSERGVCASAGAACSSGSLEPSHVLKAMNIPAALAHGAIRFSLSRYTTQQEIDSALGILPAVIDRLRRVLPVGER
jgi:cysteine desulfurase